MGRATARRSQIIVPPEEEQGQAMRELTIPQQRFVVALVELGARNNTQAAMMAGYGGTDAARKVAAKVLMRSPKVLAAIREEADKRLRSGALLAASRLYELIDSNDEKVALKASIETLNRSDLIVATEHRVTVTDNRSREDVIKAIVAMAKKNNLDPKTLLGFDPEVKPVDAEFKEVLSTECIQTVDMSSDGLEDLL